MDARKIASFVKKEWHENVIPSLSDFIRIPNVSPAFDREWDTNGLQVRAFDHVTAWAKSQRLENCKIELLKDAGRTPLLIMEIEAHASEDRSCMLYAHIDKQPPMGTWMEGLGPCRPAIRDGKLYGRGAVDDGYGFYCAITSVKAIQAQGLPCPRIVMLFEGCEESGSRDLPHYMDKLSDRIGTPDLICCLDAGCGNYEQLWMTTSLRGNVACNLKVQMLTEGVHSGNSGIVPSSFRICRELLSRIEDEKTGRVVPESLHAEVPLGRVRQAEAAAKILGATVTQQFSFVEGGHPVARDAPIAEHILSRTWRPALSVTGCDGLPPSAVAGNVMLPFTQLKLSMRLPPTLDAAKAAQQMREILTGEPPQGAHVTYEPVMTGNGWHAPLEAEWLDEAVHKASLTYFDKPCAHIGEGGSIPFMSMLLDKFPDAQFFVTGAAGPGNNMHAPNENLHIDYSSRLTMCVAHVVATLASSEKFGKAASKKASVQRKSFLQSFEQSGGSGLFFIGCDCGIAGCVIFDQGKENVCRPVKQPKR